MPIDPKIWRAIDLLASFKVGDKVAVTLDGREHEMYISRSIRRSDGEFGSVESSRVTVTFGPGRYATEVTAEQVAAGRKKIAAIKQEEQS